MRDLSLILILLTVGCQNNDIEPFTGHWYNCDIRGKYSEIHILSDTSVLSFVSQSFGPSDKYILTNDTLIFVDTLYMWSDPKGNPGISTTMIVVEDEETLRLLMAFNDTILEHTFSRFPVHLDTFNIESSIDQFQANFERREKLISCTDIRTDEQIKLDSISELELRKLLDSLEVGLK